MNEKINKIKDIVKQKLNDDSSHNMDHILRVLENALCIASEISDVDLEILQMAVLLHDIARPIEDRDKSGSIDHAILGADMAEEILKDMDIDEVKISAILHCIKSHRIRSSFEPITIEAKILFDADKIDVLGAIGIARMYMTAGQYGQQLYSDISMNEYFENLVEGKKLGRIKDMSKHSPNLEYELKIKKIFEKLYTNKGKQIAEERLKFMDEFFCVLKNELKLL